jgi:chromate transport protein ChrA
LNALFQFLVPIAVGAVAVVLLMGLVNMLRGGSSNTSQKLMRWRVGLQAVAVVVIMTAIWFMGRQPG